MKFRGARRYLDTLSGVKRLSINIKGTDKIVVHLIILTQKGKSGNRAIVIVNGKKFAIQESWTVILSMLIKVVGKYGDIAIGKWKFDELKEETCTELRKRFLLPIYAKDVLMNELDSLLKALEDIANGETCFYNEEVSLLDYAGCLSGPISMDFIVNATVRDEEGLKYVEYPSSVDYFFNTATSEMRMADWIEVVEKLRKEAYVYKLNFTGIEPTSSENLPGLIKVARDFVTKLETNGIKLADEKYCNSLVDANLDEVEIILYSSNPEVHDEISKTPNGFQNTLQGIKNALEAGFKVYVNIPIIKEEQNYMETIKYLQELGVKNVKCFRKFAGNQETDPLTVRKLEKILGEATKFCKENNMTFLFTTPGLISRRIYKKIGLEAPICNACIYNMAILPNGDVLPCKNWNRNMPLGNILQTPWEKIWNSPKTKNLKSRIIGSPFSCKK